MPDKEIEFNGEVITFPDGTPDVEIEKILVQLSTMPKGNQQMATSEQFTGPPTKPSAAGGPSTVGFLKNAYNELSGIGDSIGQYINTNAGKKPEDFIVGAAQDIGGAITPAKIADFLESRYNAYTGGNALGEIYNQPASFLSDVAGVAGAAPGAARTAGQAGRAVGRGAKAVAGPAGAFAKGAAYNTPLVGPMIKGGAREVERYYKPKPAPKPSPNAGGRLGGRAPALEAEIDKSLRTMLGPEEAPTVTAPPEPTITSPGRQGDALSSGTPSVSASRYAEIEGTPATPPPPVEPPAAPTGPQPRLGGRSPVLEDELEKAMRDLMEKPEPAPVAVEPTTPEVTKSWPEPGSSGAMEIDPAETRARGLTPPEDVRPVSADAPVTGDMLADTERRLMEQADAEALAQSNKPAIAREAERAAELERAKAGLPEEPKANVESPLLDEISANNAKMEQLHYNSQSMSESRGELPAYEAAQAEIKKLALRNKAIHAELNGELPDPNVPKRVEIAGISEPLSARQESIFDRWMTPREPAIDVVPELPAPNKGGWVEEGDPGTENWAAERERIPEAGSELPNVVSISDEAVGPAMAKLDPKTRAAVKGLLDNPRRADPNKLLDAVLETVGDEDLAMEVFDELVDEMNTKSMTEPPEPTGKPAEAGGPKKVGKTSTKTSRRYIKELKSTEKPERFESGAKPGSKEAKSAEALHRDEWLADQLYRRLLEDPSK